MPLFANARELLRANLVRIMNGQSVHAVSIGTLSGEQLAAINAIRAGQELVPIVGEVLFVGAHIYKRRVVADGYTIDDVLDQISSAMQPSSIVSESAYMTAMENPDRRADRYGNSVADRAVFECSTRHPRPELFSVTPKGDKKRPTK
jgi:hypothetical protein